MPAPEALGGQDRLCISSGLILDPGLGQAVFAANSTPKAPDPLRQQPTCLPQSTYPTSSPLHPLLRACDRTAVGRTQCSHGAQALGLHLLPACSAAQGHRPRVPSKDGDATGQGMQRGALPSFRDKQAAARGLKRYIKEFSISF